MDKLVIPDPTIREWVAAWLDFWSYVLGPRLRCQRDKDLRWSFCYNSVVVEWLQWRLPWTNLLFERYEVSRWELIKCRYQGHPAGVIYYNPGGLEPDMHCLNCNEDLG